MDDNNIRLPAHYTEIKQESEKINFSMLSDLQTGSLLRTLVNTKPSGQFLELGHIDNVARLIHQLEAMPSLSLTKMNWSTGIVIATKLD